VILKGDSGWAGGIPDVRFRSDSVCSANYAGNSEGSSDEDGPSLGYLSDDTQERELLTRFVILDEKGEIGLSNYNNIHLFSFVLCDGDHVLSTLPGLFLSGRLYVDMPDGGLPAGSKECFVNLLEYAEEQLAAEQIFVCIDKQHMDRAMLIRTFMFIGFEVVDADEKSVDEVLKNERFTYLGYDLQ